MRSRKGRIDSVGEFLVDPVTGRASLSDEWEFYLDGRCQPVERAPDGTVVKVAGYTLNELAVIAREHRVSDREMMEHRAECRRWIVEGP